MHSKIFQRFVSVVLLASGLAAIATTSCIRQKPASRSYGIEDRDNLDPEMQRAVNEACMPEDEAGLLDPDTEAQIKSDCFALHQLAVNMQAGRNGKVKVHIQKKKSDLEEFLPSADMANLLGAMSKAVAQPDESDVLRFFGCRITPALGDPNTLLGQKGTGTNNPKDCTAFATDSRWGTTVLGDTRQFEFVFVRGADAKLYQAIRVTGNWQELSAIFIYRKPMARTVMVTHRPDSWAPQIAFPAPLPSDRFFEGKEGSGEQEVARQMLGLQESDKAPRDLEEFSQVWLKQQVDGARRVAVGVSAAVILSAASLPALTGAMGSFWTATAGTVGYFTAGASSGAAVAAGITSAGSAGSAMAASAFGVAIAAGGIFTAASIPLHRWIDDLPRTPLKTAMQTAYYVMVAADVYSMGRSAVVHTARAFGTSKKLLGTVFNPESWSRLFNLTARASGKQEIVSTLNSKGGPAWERFRLAVHGLRNAVTNMRGTRSSAPRNLPPEIQLEIQGLLSGNNEAPSTKTDVAARVRLSQMLEENFIKSRLADLERAFVTSGLGIASKSRPL